MTLITVASAERPLNKRVTPFSAHGSDRPSMANQVYLNDPNDSASLDRKVYSLLLMSPLALPYAVLIREPLRRGAVEQPPLGVTSD